VDVCGYAERARHEHRAKYQRHRSQHRPPDVAAPKPTSTPMMITVSNAPCVIAQRISASAKVHQPAWRDCVVVD
jgi:hypothetical protein